MVVHENVAVIPSEEKNFLLHSTSFDYNHLLNGVLHPQKLGSSKTGPPSERVAEEIVPLERARGKVKHAGEERCEEEDKDGGN